MSFGKFRKLKKYDPEPSKRFIESVNRQREDSLLGKTKTDYTGDLKTPDYTGDLEKPHYTGDLEKPHYTGDLTKTDEDSDETIVKLLSRPLLVKRRNLLGM